MLGVYDLQLLETLVSVVNGVLGTCKEVGNLMLGKLQLQSKLFGLDLFLLIVLDEEVKVILELCVLLLQGLLLFLEALVGAEQVRELLAAVL